MSYLSVLPMEIETLIWKYFYSDNVVTQIHHQARQVVGMDACLVCHCLDKPPFKHKGDFSRVPFVRVCMDCFENENYNYIIHCYFQGKEIKRQPENDSDYLSDSDYDFDSEDSFG